MRGGGVCGAGVEKASEHGLGDRLMFVVKHTSHVSAEKKMNAILCNDTTLKLYSFETKLKYCFGFHVVLFTNLEMQSKHSEHVLLVPHSSICMFTLPPSSS